MQIPFSRISTLLVFIAVASIVAGCGTPRSTTDIKSTVDEAVALYIAGDFEGAENLFQKVLSDPDSDEDLLTAHLYLGRIYLAKEEYGKAANVLSAGKALGGDVRFDEYFEMAASHLRAASSQIIQEDVISRGQLAALLYEIFGGALEIETGERGGSEKATDAGNDNWADTYVRFAEKSGVMKRLPDGSFHADDKVTRPAFFVFVSRLTHLLGLPDSVTDDLFPGGVRGAIASLDEENADEEEDGCVSGREAIVVLKTVAEAAEFQQSTEKREG